MLFGVDRLRLYFAATGKTALSFRWAGRDKDDYVLLRASRQFLQEQVDPARNKYSMY